MCNNYYEIVIIIIIIFVHHTNFYQRKLCDKVCHLSHQPDNRRRVTIVHWLKNPDPFYTVTNNSINSGPVLIILGTKNNRFDFSWIKLLILCTKKSISWYLAI